ncbi:gene transfer agent family protein [Rhizobium sp. AN80A]|uniref:gene transfer agent family protein n=1 Tax=Rhizobium sp. AN80A TaxID=3040673 RepID=UPI0024B3A284|nr:gene transfer agent family protein [Rhizobium sp. AN80A]
MRGSETIVWPGGEHEFRLGIGELRALEQRCDAGCAVVMMRLLGQQWKIDDVIQPIRLGLMATGTPQDAAQKIIDSAMDMASPYALAITAAEILRRFIMWEMDDKPGEPQAGAESPTQTRFQTDEPGGPVTTGPEPS